MSRKIYVASSWRNSLQPDVVKALRNAGHEPELMYLLGNGFATNVKELLVALRFERGRMTAIGF